MEKVINDATKTKMGDIYQYIIALKDCFKLRENETLLIELRGDVSIIDENEGKVQKEIKHHASDDRLTDRDIDFWKTLANWYVSYNQIKNFNNLILFTTSEIPINSNLHNWNKKNKEERLLILKSIGKTKKEKEQLFRKEYDRIFNTNYNEGILLNILERFTIEQKQENIKTISTSIYPYLSTIPDANKENFIASLLGVILIKITKEPFKWIITYDDFQQIIQTEASKYFLKGTKPLPTDYAFQNPSSEQKKSLSDKNFVKEIKDIEYAEVIPEAISDYWKTNMTIVKYFQDNPVYFRDLDLYKNDLHGRMNAVRRNSLIDAEGETKEKQIKISKKLYNSVISWDAKDFGSIINNQSFFQHGVIHNIVDAKEFTWSLFEEED